MNLPTLSHPVFSKSLSKTSWQKMPSEAEMKFWRTPELVEKLLPFLNLESTLILAKTHEMTRRLLQGTSIWNKLIRRNCPFVDLPNPDLCVPRKIQVKIDWVKSLVEILKLMQDPEEALLLDLLDVICERFATDAVFLQNANQWKHTHVSMGCPRHPDGHVVPLSAFLLLEEVEAAFSTTLQSLDSVRGGILVGETQLAVSSRITRQKGRQGRTTTLSNVEFEVNCMESLTSFKGLMQLMPALTQRIELEVLGSIGIEGWETLAETLKLQPNVVGRLTVYSAALGEATKKDLHEIWDALEQTAGFVHVLGHAWHERIEKQNGAWMQLEEILDFINSHEEDTYDSEDEEEDDDQEEEEDEDKEESEDLEQEDLGPVHHK